MLFTPKLPDMMLSNDNSQQYECHVTLMLRKAIEMLLTINFEMTDRKNRKRWKQWKQTKKLPKVVLRAAADFVRQLKICSFSTF